MSTIANDIRAASAGMASLLKFEPRIRANFAGADLFTTAAIIAVVIGKGIDTEAAIYSYLAKRECPHDEATIHFLLNAYAGADRRHCVWMRSKAGLYSLLV